MPEVCKRGTNEEKKEEQTLRKLLPIALRLLSRFLCRPRRSGALRLLFFPSLDRLIRSTFIWLDAGQRWNGGAEIARGFARRLWNRRRKEPGRTFILRAHQETFCEDDINFVGVSCPCEKSRNYLYVTSLSVRDSLPKRKIIFLFVSRGHLCRET